MPQHTEEHREQQGAGHPQANRASMVKHQDPGRKQESRSRQAVAVPKKALEQQRQNLLLAPRQIDVRAACAHRDSIEPSSVR